MHIRPSPAPQSNASTIGVELADDLKKSSSLSGRIEKCWHRASVLHYALINLAECTSALLASATSSNLCTA